MPRVGVGPPRVAVLPREEKEFPYGRSKSGGTDPPTALGRRSRASISFAEALGPRSPRELSSLLEL